MNATVLVVEDEENVRYVTAGALRLAGFTVTESSLAREALHALAVERASYDLMILDVMLPDLDGFELCRRLRAERVEIPIVFLTARDGPADRVRGLTIGGDDYLTKPFSVEELVARVRVILRRVGKGVTSSILTAGDLALDDNAHMVRLDGEEVSISLTEYKLLRFLLRHKGQAMTRGQILDHVWDYAFDGESTVVESAVSTLRKKVDRDGLLIHTVRGVGYRLEG